jgi:DNA methyltransferase 1-associated protein 1
MPRNDGQLDEDWSKEETDYLFKVTRDYDGRWYVIHDRYDFPGGAPRTLEVYC